METPCECGDNQPLECAETPARRRRQVWGWLLQWVLIFSLLVVLATLGMYLVTTFGGEPR